MPAYWRPGPYYLLPGRRAVDSHPAPFRSAIQLPGVPPGYHWVTPPVESTTAHAARVRYKSPVYRQTHFSAHTRRLVAPATSTLPSDLTMPLFRLMLPDDSPAAPGCMLPGYTRSICSPGHSAIGIMLRTQPLGVMDQPCKAPRPKNVYAARATLQPAARRREGAEHIQSLSVTSVKIPVQSRHTPTWPGHPAHFSRSWYRLIHHGPRAVRTRDSPRRAALLILAHFRHSTQAALPLHPQHLKYKRTTSAITAMIADIRYF